VEPTRIFTLPVPRALQGIAHFSLRVDGAVSLQLLAGFVPRLETAGRAQINAAIAGTVTSPPAQRKGSCRGARHSVMGISRAGLSNVAGDFNFDATRMMFENVTAESGGGPPETSAATAAYGEGPR